jgi:hypothetical protein
MPASPTKGGWPHTLTVHWTLKASAPSGNLATHGSNRFNHATGLKDSAAS